MRDKTSNDVDQKVWELFEKSGNAGYFMLYSALKNNSLKNKK
ncbi:MAG: hypothetical protein WCR54_03430 [Clostridia bacterium]